MTDRDEQMLTDRDVAQLLQVSRKTVHRLTEEDPDFPRPVKVGRQDRWTFGDIRDWQKLQKLKAKAAASVCPNPETKGHPRTSAKGG